jgi:60 kDa SS-A/Ro ribonucleoprotein
MNYAKHVSTRKTSQQEAIPGKPMVLNSAGGYAFAVDDWQRLDRFLILGSEGGSYYASEKKLTVENAQAVLRCYADNPARVVDRIVEISESGRAPKNDPAIFALAMIVGQKADCLNLVAKALPKVCRIGTHLFQFAEAVQSFRGWGRSLRRMIGDWYLSLPPEKLAYQVVKYQQRNGWSHRDLLRLSHARPDNDRHAALFKWITKGIVEVDSGPAIDTFSGENIVLAFEKAKRCTDKKEICSLILERDLPRECIPTQFLNEPEVWEALLESMPLTAMVRNLGKMSAVGLLKPMSAAVRKVVVSLGNEEWIRKARVHPVALLMALKTYAQGHGEKGSLTWTPVPQVIDALDDAFYLAFGNVPVTGKRWLFGIDVSGSMISACAGTSMTCCEGATAMALVTAHREKDYHIMAFNQGLQALPISHKTRLDDALKHTRSINGGGTDCSLPMMAALQDRVPIDIFVCLTDSETWAGRIHPVQALQEYRNKMGIPAKLVVVGMTSNGFTIADPNDGGMLDCCGWDVATPTLITQFAQGLTDAI